MGMICLSSFLTSLFSAAGSKESSERSSSASGPCASFSSFISRVAIAGVSAMETLRRSAVCSPGRKLSRVIMKHNRQAQTRSTRQLPTKIQNDTTPRCTKYVGDKTGEIEVADFSRMFVPWRQFEFHIKFTRENTVH